MKRKRKAPRRRVRTDEAVAFYCSDAEKRIFESIVPFLRRRQTGRACRPGKVAHQMTSDVAPRVENAATTILAQTESLDGLRLLRGRALLRLDPSELGEHQTDGGVWVPDSAVRPRDQKIHRGTVLALGPPARQGGNLGPEIPWGCAVGDSVVFAYGVWLQRMRQWDDLAVVAHSEILAVIE